MSSSSPERRIRARNQCFHLLQGVLSIYKQDSDALDVSLICVISELRSSSFAHSSRCIIIKSLDGAQHVSIQSSCFYFEHEMPHRGHHRLAPASPTPRSHSTLLLLLSSHQSSSLVASASRSIHSAS
eukprot:scaffold101427_cov38-Tisochrysis_lutea.AAC.4